MNSYEGGHEESKRAAFKLQVRHQLSKLKRYTLDTITVAIQLCAEPSMPVYPWIASTLQRLVQALGAGDPHRELNAREYQQVLTDFELACAKKFRDPSVSCSAAMRSCIKRSGDSLEMHNTRWRQKLNEFDHRPAELELKQDYLSTVPSWMLRHVADIDLEAITLVDLMDKLQKVYTTCERLPGGVNAASGKSGASGDDEEEPVGRRQRHVRFKTPPPTDREAMEQQIQQLQHQVQRLMVSQDATVAAVAPVTAPPTAVKEPSADHVSELRLVTQRVAQLERELKATREQVRQSQATAAQPQQAPRETYAQDSGSHAPSGGRGRGGYRGRGDNASQRQWQAREASPSQNWPASGNQEWKGQRAPQQEWPAQRQYDQAPQGGGQGPQGGGYRGPGNQRTVGVGMVGRSVAPEPARRVRRGQRVEFEEGHPFGPDPLEGRI
jgi:hypothetical protein